MGAQGFLFAPGPAPQVQEDPLVCWRQVPGAGRKRRAPRRHRWVDHGALALRVRAYRVWVCDKCGLARVRWTRRGPRCWPVYLRLSFDGKGRRRKTKEARKVPPCAQVELFSGGAAPELGCEDP